MHQPVSPSPACILVSKFLNIPPQTFRIHLSLLHFPKSQNKHLQGSKIPEVALNGPTFTFLAIPRNTLVYNERSICFGASYLKRVRVARLVASDSILNEFEVIFWWKTKKTRRKKWLCSERDLEG